MELEPVAVRREDAVDHKRVDVDVQVQRATEPLNDRNGPAPAVRGALLTRTPSQEPEYRPYVDADDRSTQVVVPREQIAEAIRQAQDPLSDRYIREYVIHHVRCALGHPTPTATWTETATFARKRHEAVMPTGVAVKARESRGETAAGQKLAKFALDETRQPFPVAKQGCLRAKRLEVVTDEAVEHAVYRISRLIRDGGLRHGRGTRFERAITRRDESGGNRVLAR